VIERRAFLGMVASGLVATPRAANAEQTVQSYVRQVGWLALAPLPQLQGEFKSGMRDLGYVEGASYRLLECYADEKVDRLSALAVELMALKPDVVVAEAIGPARTMQRATKTVPVVFITGDPVTNGFVRSLGRPGGNLTGVANLSLELYPKRIEALKAALPKLQRLAVLAGPTVRPHLVEKIVQDASRAQAIEPLPVVFLSRPEDLEQAFARAAHARADAALVTPNPFFNAQRDRLIALAARYRLPALYEFRDFVEAGGFMCYGPDNKDVYRRVAFYVDRILKGANPADLPVEQPTRYELVINLKTAKALGLTIPPSLLQRADQLIE
jgi:putative tryptophan/tyrosine transport system substrate-binding protein